MGTICNVDRKALFDAINDIATSPLWPSVCRYAVETSWMGWTQLDERRKSTVLAWLLDPRQGHGLGDFFLKRLIMSAVSRQPLGGYPSYSLSTCTFSPALVDTEVAIDELDAKRFIDILVVVPGCDLAVVIERKDGSGENNDQFSSYRAWALKHLDKAGYHVLFVASGNAPWLNDSSCPQGWAYLDDERLLDALSMVDRTGEGSSAFRSELHNLRHFVFGDWDESDGGYHSGLEHDCALFFHQYSRQLSILRGASIQVGNVTRPILGMPTSLLAGKVLAEISGDDHDALWFFINNMTTLEYLLDFNDLYPVELALRNTINEELAFSPEKPDAETGGVLNVCIGGQSLLINQKGQFLIYLQFRQNEDGHYETLVIRRKRISQDQHQAQLADAIMERLLQNDGFTRTSSVRIHLPARYSGPMASVATWAPDAVREFVNAWKEASQQLS